MEPRNDCVEYVGKEAALLSAVEVGLGSVLHGFHVPMAGHFLSVNQIFLLSRTAFSPEAKDLPRSLPFQISGVSSLLKSLSPAGKKLTPMLAISAQGGLFNLGTAILGANLVGALVGGLLSGAWAFLQPWLILFLLYGKTLISVGEYYLEKMQEVWSIEPQFLLKAWLLLFFVKSVVVVFAIVAAKRMSKESYERYARNLLRFRRKRAAHAASESAARAAWRELFSPLFLLSVVLTALFFFLVEASFAQLIWNILRPIAVGFLLFYFWRVALSRGWLGTSIERTIRRLKEMESRG